ncbi:MAG: class I SAM-dependent methyltransferase [Polyangiaceae bacterium]
MTLISVPCPVCDQTDFAPLYPSTIEQPDENPASYFSSGRTQAGYLPIVRCRACGLVQQSPRDDLATLNAVYGSLSDGVYDSEDKNRDRDAKAHLDLVLSQQKPPARLLDVGCSTGTFAARAQQAGFEAAGIDASHWAIERAKARRSGADFRSGTLESAAFPERSFQVVTLFDVLEHVHSPNEALAHIHRWLSPGGLLVMSLPNASSWVAKAMGKRWVLLLREHLWYFSPATVGRLLERAGFQLVKTRPKWVSFSLGNIATRAAQYPGPLAGPTAMLAKSALLRRAPARFPMGEMDVVARRAE